MAVGAAGLAWQTVQFSFTGGLQTKTHAHAVEAPELIRALNIEFDEFGGVRLRHPYAAIGTNIYGGGTLSNVRKLVVVGNELLAFTATELYVWSETLSRWLLKGTHAAVAVSETTRFANPNDQVFGDRAQLGGVIVYVWVEVQAGGTKRLYLAAADATTDATVIAPVNLGAGRDRPRVVALDTKILVLWLETGVGLVAKAIDPAAPAFTAAGATVVTANEKAYDVVRDPAADRAVAVVPNAIGTAYDIVRVTAGLAITASTKARIAPGAIAVAISPNGYAQVVRQAGGASLDILGDMIVVASLADNVWDQVIGTAGTSNINQLTCAYRSVQDAGEYRCYVYWSVDENDSDGTSPDFELKSNWFGTSLLTGTETVFLYRQGVAARAFDYGGHVYLWSVFASSSQAGFGDLEGIQAPYQNTYFLHRDDGELISKSTWQRAGGYGYYGYTAALGHLPGVALVSGTTGYAWCGIERQMVTTLSKVGRTYGARAPRDVLFTFDSDLARRVVQLGRTAYVSGGLLLQYDGDGLVEVGFQQFPWYLSSSTTGGAGGAVPAGKYTHKASVRWDNARGEMERSTTATGVQCTLGATDQITLVWAYLHVTRKQGARRKAAFELWRTKVNPPNGSPFYLVTSKDPAAPSALGTDDNGYIENLPAVLSDTGSPFNEDNFTDAILATKEQHPENNGSQPRMAPPGATIMAASDSRLFLAGVPGEPTTVWYSLLRKSNEVAAFNSLLSFELPAATGPITALALWQETLVVFTATAIYAMPGDGYDNIGRGTNYGPPRLVSSDLGCLSHDALVLTPDGPAFFSRKGWYRLNGGWALEYIGGDVEDYNSDTWVAAQVVQGQHQIRVLSTTRMLVFDYLVGKWAEWTQTGGRGLAVYRGDPMLLDTAPKRQSAGFAAVDYDQDVEMLIKFQGLLGFSTVKRFTVLGEHKADHAQRIRVARDLAVAYMDDATTTFTGLTAGDPTRVQHGPSQKRVSALRVRITVRATDGTTPAYDAVTLTGIAFELGFERGLYPRLAATQKQ